MVCAYCGTVDHCLQNSTMHHEAKLSLWAIIKYARMFIWVSLTAWEWNYSGCGRRFTLYTLAVVCAYVIVSIAFAMLKKRKYKKEGL